MTAQKPLTLLLPLSVVLFCTLLGVTFAINSKETKNKNDQTQNPLPSSNIENPTTAMPAEPAEEVSTEQTPPTTDATHDSVSPGQSASNSSHTSINISSNNGSAVNGIYSLKISDNGCTVEANGPSGTQLIIDAKNGKKGGQQTYTLDGSPKTVPSGGMLPGMTIEARLIDSSESIRATSSTTIGSAGCS